jgi:hypothetical protein
LRPRDTIASFFDESSDAKMAALVRPVGGIPLVWLAAGSGRMDRYNRVGALDHRGVTVRLA